MKNPKFTIGQIVSLEYDKVIKNEVLSVTTNNCSGGFNYKVRQFSKYGEHGKKEFHESCLTEN